MGNKIYEIFNPNSDYNKRIEQQIKEIQRQWIEERSCFVCKHDKDISDDRTTCHLCKYTDNFLPDGLTCLLWELKEEYENA